MKEHAYVRARYLTRVLLPDLVLVAAFGLALASGNAVLATALGAAVPVVLVWGVVTLHFPSRVVVSGAGIAFSAYGRSHAFAWEEIQRLHVRRFLVRDRVLVRLGPAPAWGGRYWITDGISDFEGLVRALEARAG